MPSAVDGASEDEGRELLTRTRAMFLASISAAGAPVLDAVDTVVDDGFLVVRAAGREIDAIGRAVVVGACERVASVGGSYSVSVQVEGVLEGIEHPARQARALAALTTKYPTTAGPVPRRSLARLPLDRVSCRATLGQDRPPAERLAMLDQLWRRGAPGDVEAIARLLTRFPELGTPTFLRLPDAVQDRRIRLQCALHDDAVDDVIPLLQGLYWLAGLPPAEIRAAILSSTVRVAARDAEGRVVAFARAVSDGKCAWVYDVAVAEPLRSARVGAALMGLLLDHPAVRGVRHVRLSTRDAMPFYRRLGFCTLEEAPRYAWTSTEMIKTRLRVRSERADQTEPRVVTAEDRNQERPGQTP